MSSLTVPPILASLIGRISAAVPARARTTFLELLMGAAATKGGHVTDAILAGGLARAWTTYYWFLEYGRWSWLHVWQTLPGALTALFAPAVWHVIVDDTVTERISTRAPGSLIHHSHHAKPNRPAFAWPGLAVPGRSGRTGLERGRRAADAASFIRNKRPWAGFSGQRVDPIVFGRCD